MVSEKMLKALNKQIEMEAYASFLYLSMASWFDLSGLEGCARFMYRQAGEEKTHMMRIFNYLIELDQKAVVPAIKKPPVEFESVPDAFTQAYEHERRVSESINNLVDLAIKENDHTTHVFLQWYVDEQREEEALMRLILDKIRIIGNGPQSLYFIDKELESFNSESSKGTAP